MTPGRRSRPAARASERGSILIHVAIMIFVLLAGIAFVVDFGVVWLARGQAQNAADAGALAGAIARAFDEAADPPSAAGPTHTAAIAAAQANRVLGEAPGVAVSWDCPGYVTPSTRCVRVDAFRDGTNGSTTLPVYFAPLFGLTSQGIKATATAQAIVVNASDCLRPWGVADRWQEQYDNPLTFDGYDKKTGAPIAGGDRYVPPTETGATGYSIPTDYGARLTLKLGQAKDESQISSGWFAAVDLPNPDGTFATGGSAYRDRIRALCGATGPVQIGSFLPTETGNMVGPTVQGVEDLVAQDPGAYWDASSQAIAGSCAATHTCPGGRLISPRVVAVAVFDPDRFQRSQASHDWSYCPLGGSCVQIANIFGFFVEGVQNSGDVTGIMIKRSGVSVPGGWSIGDPSAFLYTVRLVR